MGITRQEDVKSTAEVIIYSEKCFPGRRGVAIGFRMLELQSLQDIEWYPKVFENHGFDFNKLIVEHPRWNPILPVAVPLAPPYTFGLRSKFYFITILIYLMIMYRNISLRYSLLN